MKRFLTCIRLYYGRIITVLLIINLANICVLSQQESPAQTVTIYSAEKFFSLDMLTAMASDAAADRLRTLIFNSLVKKDEKLDYTGDLAQEIKTSKNGKIVTFVLRDNVKFHNGRSLTAADIKYTFDELFKSDSYKSNAFFETIRSKKVPHITSIEVSDPKTVNFVLSRASLKDQVLSNLVVIPIIPEGTVEKQNTQPTGTGPFKFVNFDQAQNIVELQANSDYFEGAPEVQHIRVKTVRDANVLQAEFQSGSVDIALLNNYLTPDILKSLNQNPELKAEQFNGSNIDYLGFNTRSPVLKNIKIRQAVAYGIDRQRIINELLFGQAKIAHSILPVESWAYFEGTKYNYNPAKAKQLVQESGYKKELIRFKISVGNRAVIQYAQVIQSSLQEIGLNVEIEALEPNVLRQQLVFGEFQMNTGRWINGNQDPIFLRDLFSTSKIPSARGGCCNRSRYTNPTFDKIVDQAFNSPDREVSTDLYAKAQKIVSNDLPLLPLWYPANIVVYNKRIGNVKINPSGDWSFIKNLRVNTK